MCYEKLLVASYIVCTLVQLEVDMQIIKVGKDAKVYRRRYRNNLVLEMIVQSDMSIEV